MRVFFNKEDSSRYKEKIFISHFNIKKNNNKKLIWFHAASIGELKSIFPIIENLNTHENEREFLVTTSTLSSSKIADIKFKNYNNIHHRFFPYDVSFLINKFLKLWKPSYIFLVDSEIWPNLILGAKKFKIPLAIINARITKKSYKKWLRFPNSASKIFGSFDLCLAASKDSELFLKNLGVKKINFHGNIKFIKNIDANKITNLNENILRKRPFWFAASTHPGEEEMCFKTHLFLKEKINNILTIIAPRHIDRSQKIKISCENYNLETQILNKSETIQEDKDVIILNSFGELQNYFKYAKSTFIGKSFIEKLQNVGGQNPLEAAQLNCKIYHGPFVYNFKEIYKILEEYKIAKQINNHEELGRYLVEDLDQSNKKYDNNSNSLNDFSNKILINTLKDINNLMTNETN